MNNQQNQNIQLPVTAKVFLILGLIAAFGFLIGALGNEPAGFMIGTAGLFLAIPFFFIARRKASKDRQSFHEKELQRAFYDKCLSYKITAINTPQNLEKAKTIAKSMNCPAKALKNLSAYFEEIKRERMDQAEAVRLEGLEKKRSEEESTHASLTRYAGYAGKDKRIAMLEDERISFLQKAAHYNELVKTGTTFGQQKEIDWATRGGIVSGLAGGAAGVAAAVDAQVKNTQIRANNAAIRQFTGPAVVNFMSEANACKKSAERMAVYIAEAKMKIVNKTLQEEVLKKIAFASPSVSVSPTGAISIKVAASVIRPVKILDSADGVIDGTVFAEFYDGKKLVGKAELVLPLWGLKKDVVPLEGICLSGGKEGTNYRIEYKAKHLWEMEA